MYSNVSNKALYIKDASCRETKSLSHWRVPSECRYDAHHDYFDPGLYRCDCALMKHFPCITAHPVHVQSRSAQRSYCNATVLSLLKPLP